MSEKFSNLSVTLLGPKDSFSDQFLEQCGFGNLKINYATSISGVFEVLNNSLDSFGIVPLENLLNGQVSATFDGLTRNYNVEQETAPRFEIIHSDNLLIELYIGADPKRDFPLLEVEEVFSHEQALAQSEKYLLENCPNAILTAVESTSAAVELVNKSNKKTMAIASRAAIENRDLRAVAKTTPQSIINKTRFGIISTQKNKELILSQIKGLSLDDRSTSLCLFPRMDRQGLLLDILSLVSEKNQCNLLSIHSRPDQTGGFIFYLELENNRSDDIKIQRCIQDISDYLKNETGGAGSLYNLGTYSRKSFVEQSIDSVSIIGANGAMGQWFSKFFEARGIYVHKIEKNPTKAETLKIKDSQVILFSVPILEVENALKGVLPFIPKHSLIVDNSSVKTETLKMLTASIPDEIEFASIHTMFGPNEDSLKGKNVIFVDTGRTRELTLELERLFYKYGAIITHVSLDEHDKRVAYTQAIVHFISLGLGNFLKTEHVQLDLLRPFLTPNTERLLHNLNRVLSQSQELSQGILVENPYSKSLRDIFLQSLSEISSAIEAGELGKVLDSLSKYKR